MRIRTALMLVLSALALALALSSCAVSSVKSSVDPVAVAAEQTVKAQTVHVSMTMSEEAPSLPAPLTIAADGVEDFTNQRAAMNMDMSALASLAGERLGSPDDWKIETVMDGPHHLHARTLLPDGAQAGQALGQDRHGKRWQAGRARSLTSDELRPDSVDAVPRLSARL
jgi:hypothetical protein